jgi:hypothetical protein
MDYKNILAIIVACFMLTDVGLAMDQPLKLQKEQSNFKTRDSGVIAIRLANQYLKASSNTERMDSIKALCNYLTSLDNNNIFRVASIEIAHEDDINWTNTFCNLQKDNSNHHDLMQKFKTHVYTTYFEREGKKPICALLQEIAHELQQDVKKRELKSKDQRGDNEDILKSLELLTKALPERKNKIDIVMKYLRKYFIDISELSDAFKKLCEKEKSSGEKARLVAEDSSLPFEDKKIKLKALKKQALAYQFPVIDEFGNPIEEPFAASMGSNAFELLYLMRSEQPNTALLQLLWLEDSLEVEKAIKSLEKKPIGEPKAELEEKIEQLLSLDPEGPNEAIQDHFQILLNGIYRLQKLLKLQKNDPDLPVLLERYKAQLNDSENKMIEHFFDFKESSKVVVEWFKKNDPLGEKIFDRFSKKKFKYLEFYNSTNDDYFKDFDTFLSHLIAANESSEVVKEYEVVLHCNAITKIAQNITSDPKIIQKNIFNKSERLLPYYDWQNKVNVVNAMMYNTHYRKKNIKILGEFNALITGILPNMSDNYRSILVNIQKKILFFIGLLELQECGEKNCDDAIWVNCLIDIAHDIDRANDRDIDQIEQLGKTDALVEFIAKGGSKDNWKEVVGDACKKINHKVKSFPLLEEKLLQQAIAIRLAESQAFLKEHQKQVRELEQKQQVLTQQSPVIPQEQLGAPTAPQQAPQPEEPSFFARILSELSNAILAGFSRIWRILIRG